MKAIKKFVVLLMCVSMLALTACGNYVETVANDKQPSMFVVVEGDACSLWRVVYHRETKVMYAVSGGGNNAGDFTLLVNPDGTPMVWEE